MGIINGGDNVSESISEITLPEVAAWILLHKFSDGGKGSIPECGEVGSNAVIDRWQLVWVGLVGVGKVMNSAQLGGVWLGNCANR